MSQAGEQLSLHPSSAPPAFPPPSCLCTLLFPTRGHCLSPARGSSVSRRGSRSLHSPTLWVAPEATPTPSLATARYTLSQWLCPPSCRGRPQRSAYLMVTRGSCVAPHTMEAWVPLMTLWSWGGLVMRVRAERQKRRRVTPRSRACGRALSVIRAAWRAG